MDSAAPQLKKPKLLKDDDRDVLMEAASPEHAVQTPALQMEDFSQDLLKIYYGRLFPFKEIYKWLSYGNDGKAPGSDPSTFFRREFSFTLEHDIYVRYQSFRDAEDMEAAIRDKCPHKIDIGAIYNVDPVKRTAYSSSDSDRVFAPVERELVFDVDMTDYDDIRTCSCRGSAKTCSACWPLMTIAIKVIDAALREDFGFEHLLWVFSGRRGVHCWVCDSRARRLTNEQRSAIADYFRVYKGSENNKKMVTLVGAALHPALSRALEDVLMHYFVDVMLPGLQLLSNEVGEDGKQAWERVLALIPDEGVKEQMADKWRHPARHGAEDINVVRWRELERAVKAPKAQKNPSMRRCLQEIIFSYTYPRLDLEVSKHMNHLLKAPFCVHPKSGKVCVPIDPAQCEEFDPDSVPTISQLLRELNASTSTSTQRDLEKTSMKAVVDMFDSIFLRNLLSACKSERQAALKEELQEKKGKPSLEW